MPFIEDEEGKDADAEFTSVERARLANLKAYGLDASIRSREPEIVVSRHWLKNFVKALGRSIPSFVLHKDSGGEEVHVLQSDLDDALKV